MTIGFVQMAKGERMRLIDADALKEHIKKYTSVFTRYDWREICEMLNDAPTVDAVEVVRCKDCKHNYYNMIPSGEEEHGCAKWIELPITADFYCAWGEREDGQTDNC